MTLSQIKQSIKQTPFFECEDGVNLIGENWCISADGDPRARHLFNRHYSRRTYKDGRSSKLFVGPGEKMVLVTPDYRALFVWRKFISGDGQEGVNCAIFRNESAIQSSQLIREAVQIAQSKWPSERFYTYVNPGKIKSENPGCCFKKAGWKVCGKSKGGLVILELKAGQGVLFEKA